MGYAVVPTWRLRWSLSSACLSHDGLSGSSTNTTLLAAVKSSPCPPAVIETRSTRQRSLVLNSVSLEALVERHDAIRIVPFDWHQSVVSLRSIMGSVPLPLPLERPTAPSSSFLGTRIGAPQNAAVASETRKPRYIFYQGTTQYKPHSTHYSPFAMGQ